MSQVAQKMTIGQHIADLEFVTALFSWLFMFLTRLSEPFLMLATIYIICETAVPSLHSAAWENTALAIMVTAPEFVLPGSFVVARQAKQRNEPLAGWLKAICIAFLILMALTLADVLIFHLVGYWLAGLMFVRCSVAVGYSILMRVMQHGAKPVIVEPKKEEVTQAKIAEVKPPVTQVSIAKRRLKRIEKSAFSGFISMCETTFTECSVKPVSEHSVNDVQATEKAVEDPENEKVTEPLLKVVKRPVVASRKRRNHVRKERGNGVLLIQKEIERKPEITNAEICRVTGLSASYVSSTRGRLANTQEKEIA